MSPPRHLVHPGAPAAERVSALRCHAQPITLHLRKGTPFDAALAEAAADAGLAAAYLRLVDLPLAPLAYVIPAPAPGDGRAAWYSRTYRTDAARVSLGGAHLGLRDGRAFVHCHGLWDGIEGPPMGHLLPAESILAEDCTVTGWGLTGAILDVAQDAETGFPLFHPQPRHPPAKPNALLCTLRPNQDITQALAGLGLPNARVEGIGSLVGTAVTDASSLDSYATEMLVLDGTIADGQPHLRAASIGMDGRSATGTLARGLNPICITAELLVIEHPSAPADARNSS